MQLLEPDGSTEVGLLHCRNVLCMLAASTPCPSRVGPADQTCDIVDDQDKGNCLGRDLWNFTTTVVLLPAVFIGIKIFLFHIFCSGSNLLLKFFLVASVGTTTSMFRKKRQQRNLSHGEI